MKLKHIFLLFAFIATHNALAQENELLGVWVQNKSQIDTITLSKGKLSWDVNPKFYPPCKTRYTIVNESTRETYPDNTFPAIPGRTFKVYKIELAPQKCLGGTRYLQFAIPTDSNGNYADVLLYMEDGRYAGYFNYSKRR